MVILVVLVLIFICFMIFKKKIETFLLPFIVKIRKEKMPDKDFGNDENVFSPNGTVRTFSIQLELHEQGDGRVKIVLAKNK